MRRSELFARRVKGVITMVRRARELNPDQKSLVSAVKRVARQRARVNASYVDAILQARESGVTYAAIAEAVGTSSQAVQEIVRRHASARAAEEASGSATAGSLATGSGAGIAAVAGEIPTADASGEMSSVGSNPVAV